MLFLIDRGPFDQRHWCPDPEIRRIGMWTESGHFLFVFRGLLILSIRRELRRTSRAGHEIHWVTRRAGIAVSLAVPVLKISGGKCLA